MAAGQTRAFFALIIAVTFGVLQVLCACLPANAQTVTAGMGHASVVMEHHGHAAHDDSGVMMISDMGRDNSSEPMPAGHCDPDPNGHDHVENCSHCDGINLLSTAIDLPNATPSDQTVQLVAVLPTALPAPNRAGMAGSSLGGLRWRDPPRPTPVTLKNISLT